WSPALLGCPHRRGPMADIELLAELVELAREVNIAGAAIAGVELLVGVELLGELRGLATGRASRMMRGHEQDASGQAGRCHRAATWRAAPAARCGGPGRAR